MPGRDGKAFRFARIKDIVPAIVELADKGALNVAHTK
jgi:hypothetical protein